MPIRHGAHHGLSFILGVFCSVALGELFRKILPGFIAVFDVISNFLIRNCKLGAETKVISTLILALIVAMIYGMIFGFVESRKS